MPTLKTLFLDYIEDQIQQLSEATTTAPAPEDQAVLQGALWAFELAKVEIIYSPDMEETFTGWLMSQMDEMKDRRHSSLDELSECRYHSAAVTLGKIWKELTSIHIKTVFGEGAN